MISKIFKILKESITSVSRINLWDIPTKNGSSQKISGYKELIRGQIVESSPKFCKGQLVSIKYHHRWPHLHKEIGIIVEVNDYDTNEGLGPIHFYEVLVGDEHITMLERFLDGYIGTEEESSS